MCKGKREASACWDGYINDKESTGTLMTGA